MTDYDDIEFELHQSDNLEIEYDHADEDNIPFTVVLSIFILLIILGNGTILGVVIWRKELKTPKIIYIVSLIASDLMVACIVIPLAISTQYKLLVLTPLLCKISECLKYLTVTANLYCVVAIATDRHQVIMSLFKARSQNSRSFLFVFFVWLFAAVYSLRPAMTHGLTSHNDEMVRKHVHSNTSWDHIPHSHWDNLTYIEEHVTCGLEMEDLRHLFIIIDFLVICLIPLVIITILYIRVIFWLVRQRRQNCAVSRSKNQNVKVIQMVLVIVLTYTVCQMPTHLYRMYVYFGPGVSTHAELVYDVLTIFTYFNSVLNVCIYSFFDKRIYAFVKMAFSCDRNGAFPSITSVSQTPTTTHRVTQIKLNSPQCSKVDRTLER